MDVLLKGMLIFKRECQAQLFIWESEKKILIFCFESQLQEIYNWPFNEMSFFGQ